MEFVIRPPARYPDLFPVLNVLVSTPVFGLVWLWSIKSGIEVGWAISGLGGGTHADNNPQSVAPPPATNLANPVPRKTSYSRLIHHGDAGSPLSATDRPLSPLLSFNRRIGSPPAVLGPHRPGVRERTWSSVSAKARNNLPVGPGWDQPLNFDHTERTEGGENASTEGPGVSNVRKGMSNFPGNTGAEGFPSSSD